MTFRMRSGATVPQARCMPPLAALQEISGPAFPHVPADILSGGRARRSSSVRNTQRIEAKEKRCGDVLSAVNGQIQFFAPGSSQWIRWLQVLQISVNDERSRSRALPDCACESLRRTSHSSARWSIGY